MKSVRARTATMIAVSVLACRSHAEIADGLVAHWPLDEVCGTKTPDVVGEYDMNLQNLTAADLVPGKYANAMAFDNARRTILTRDNQPGDQLPASQHESYTLSMWVNVQGTGQDGLGVFSEANTDNSDPLFAIGTHGSGADGTVDLSFNQAGWTPVNHIRTTQTAFDNTWRHLVFVQRSGVRKVYINAVEDALAIPDKEAGDWLTNNTTIGGILRAAPSHWVTGRIDDVAIWSRGLSPSEIAAVFADGVPEVITVPGPPEIHSFQAEVPRVETGGKTLLSWNGSQDATFSIEPGIGDVTTVGPCGAGSIEVTVNANTTYTLTATRNGQTKTARVTVSVRDDVADGWRLVDDFQTYATGPIARASLWKNPEGLATVAARADGNRVLGFDGGDDLNALPLGSMALAPSGELPGEGNLVTLFFRIYRKVEDSENGLGINVGLTEKPVRFVEDFTRDVGPYVRIEDADAANGTMVLGARNWDSDYTYDTETKVAATVYNIWIDIENLENSPVDTGDIFSVYVAVEGGDRTRVFENFLGDRDPEGSPELGEARDVLDTLLVSAINAAPSSGLDQDPQGVGLMFMDDFFLSKGNQFLDTVPVPASSFGDPTGGEPATIEEIRMVGGQVPITFTGTAGATYGVMAWDSLNGTPVEIGQVTASGDSDTYTDTRELQPDQVYGLEAK